MGRKIRDLTGQVFGKLTAVRIAGKFGNKTYWVTKCDCGNEKVASLVSLVSGTTRSCGCLKSGRKALPVGEAALHMLFNGYRRRANKRGYSFELSLEEFRDITSKACHYCGTQPANVWKSKRYNGSYTYNGIDRIDNTRGYTLANVVPSCHHCNRAKSDLPLADFIDWNRRVRDRFEKAA
jgi:hypothetical protein